MKEDVISKLAMGIPLPEKNRDHDLSGNWVGYRECHILPNWLLIYRIDHGGPDIDLISYRIAQRSVW